MRFCVMNDATRTKAMRLTSTDRLRDTAAEFWVAAELEELFRLHGDDQR